jgi:hypothetical protein
MNRFSPPRPPWVSGDVCDPRNSSSSNNSTECSRGALALVTTPLSTTKHEKLDPLLVSIADARMISGLSRTDLYRRMAARNIRAVKAGSRTLIVLESLIDHLKSLPAAQFHVSS